MKVGSLLQLNDTFNVIFHTLNSVLNLWISFQLFNDGETGVWGLGAISFVFIALNYIANAILMVQVRTEIKRTVILQSYWCLPTPIAVPVVTLFGCVAPALGLAMMSQWRSTVLLLEDLDNVARKSAWKSSSIVKTKGPVSSSTEVDQQELGGRGACIGSSLAVQEEFAGIDQAVTLVQKLHLVMTSTFPQHLHFYVQSIIEGIPLFLVQLIAVSRGILPDHLLQLVWVSMGSAIVSLLLKSYIGCQSLDPLVCLIRFLFIVYDVNAMIFTIVYMATVGAPGESVLTMSWLIFAAVIAFLVLVCMFGYGFAEEEHRFDFFCLLAFFAVPIGCIAAFLKCVSLSFIVFRLQPEIEYCGPEAAAFAFLRQGDWNERLRFLLFNALREKRGPASSRARSDDTLSSRPGELQAMHTQRVKDFIEDETLLHTKAIASPLLSSKIDLIPRSSLSVSTGKFRLPAFRLVAFGQLVTAALFPWVAILDVVIHPNRNAEVEATLCVLTGVAATALICCVPLCPRLYEYIVFCLEYEQLESWCQSMGVEGSWRAASGRKILSLLGDYFRPTSAAILRFCVGSSSTLPPRRPNESSALPPPTPLLIPDDVVDRLSSFLSPDAIDVSGLIRKEVFQMKASVGTDSTCTGMEVDREGKKVR
jgi:hypothetical protein